ncbi:hypothetical protein [Stutzerimonas zhaodongensis]|uniref:hypothetical protein n=1 Tax=Stutzerimonas zhaodongensis TaxID=1176257 RepID=UPI0011C4963C|nr:hypothetical protein [Stutzerimonas zhaodongensis]MCQ4318619.1 hypothetical protein [Stutzerimonas zhaodongensis]
MCWALYLASDIELPQIVWDNANPSFNTQELSEAENPVKQQFSFEHVIYLGSNEGCGCGFMNTDYQSNKNLEHLHDYLSNALSRNSKLEIFLCWEGDQSSSPLAKKSVRLSEFAGPELPLGERELSIITT